MYKKQVKIILISVTTILLSVSIITFIVDPYFHYHKPLFGLNTYYYDQRHQNYGIAKQEEYDAIITGTSMTENFRTTEFDDIFKKDSIKTSFSGGSFKEITEYLEFAIEENSDINTIFRGIDFNRFLVDSDDMAYDVYPDYLYDYNVINDMNYLLNKDVIVEDVFITISKNILGVESTTFDIYSNWNEQYNFGKEFVLQDYTRIEKQTANNFTNEDKEIVKNNINKNLIDIAEENPEITFIYFIPPYSIVYYDQINNEGNLIRDIEAVEYGVKLMLEVENIEVYSFLNDYELITNLDNYKDTIHYSEIINSRILEDINNGAGLITKNNVEEHFSDAIEFYSNYDYDKIFS